MQGERELDAAGILDPRLRADYTHCRNLAARHGRTYYLATRLLPPQRRPAIHALYGFARTVDDIVDEIQSPLPIVAQQEAIARFAADVVSAERSDEPSVRALKDTTARYELDDQLFLDFLESMRMDLTVSEYETFDDLQTYTYGSASVIGLQLLPVLGTVGPRADAEPFASDLGLAFQLTNFIRDVGEDLRRGRVYLPQESLREFGVDRDRLARGTVDAPVRALLKHEIARTRAIYARARPGIAELEPTSRRCVEVAFRLYGDILSAVEAADYQVLSGPRVTVGNGRRLAVAAPGLTSAAVSAMGASARRWRAGDRATSTPTTWP